MERKTLKELHKKWWWRRKNFRRARKGVQAPGISFDYSDDNSKRIVLNYELMRRSPEAKTYSKGYFHTKAYNELDSFTRTICSKLWNAPQEYPYRFITAEAQKSERGWFGFNPKIQWNLRLNDSALKAVFMQEINSQRKFHKIRPKRHLKGQTNRPMSWNYVEALDRAQNRIGTHSPSQRHTASVARLKAAECFIQFKRALAKWHKQPKETLEDKIADASYGGEYEFNDVD